jgi:hypothetical protein
MQTVIESDVLALDLGAFAPKPTALTAGLDEASLDLWVAADGAVESGVWECGAGSFRATRDGYHEVCQIVAGRALIRPDEGEAREVTAGSFLVTPAGWAGTWEVSEPLRKVYVIVPVTVPPASGAAAVR